ncbi:hypothetical protein [Nitrosococcus wardiae]|uniref:HEPN domain-containing protein n=1 Tax=Nitrosococcus wardiae TaxID=1814290 RepID=A0A4P7BXG2_9GAMM|nr:hypothetical protein [Nitrosococcus wardiae]QBQ53076.1 hypothetical protein E3U44_00060 [Nitrosococcus wardiae]
MITYEDIRSLSAPERFFTYAEAYLGAANAMCQQMVQDPASGKWSNAAVVLMLAAHAVELFLKGAILARETLNISWNRGHNLHELAADYRSHFPEPSFNWDIPFQGEFPVGFSEAEIDAFRKEIPAPSILYRYPVQKGGDEWQGLYGFEANSFLLLLIELKHDFIRIKTQLT